VRARRSAARRQAQQELDITAFLNLMVILVPFLLITAVFSRLAILELDVPLATSADAESDAEPTLQLEVVVRADVIEIGARDGGLFTRLPRDGQPDYDYGELNQRLAQVKADQPEETRATLLLEPEIEYDVLVQVMDAVRLHEVVNAETGLLERAELFPDIAIGDAPRREREG